jgi:hypothetical protein
MNKKIRDRNRRFQKLTGPQKRVRIAKDVLAAIAAKRIVARTGYYLNLDLSFEAEHDSGKYVGNSLTPVEEFAENNVCSACALGSMMICLASRTNDMKVGQLTSTAMAFEAIRNKLTSVFADSQIALIESAFDDAALTPEKFGLYGDMKFMEQQETAREWWRTAFPIAEKDRRGPNASNAEERLVAIMRNIVQNDGTFVP